MNSECSNSTYFHLDCLNPKRRPNNYKTNWLCSACHTSSSLPIEKNDQISFLNSKDLIDLTTESLLNDEHYTILDSANGLIDDDIVNAAQFLIKKMNFSISGYQRVS